MRWLVVVWLLCGCGSRHQDSSVAQARGVEVAKFPDGPPLVTPGERMSYRIMLGRIELASYDVAIGNLTELEGKRAVVVQAHAKAIGLVRVVTNIDDSFTSWIDAQTGRTLLWTVDEFAVRRSDRERTEVRIYAREGNLVPIDFHVNDEPPKPEPQRVSLPDVWDYNAFAIALRSWSVPPGTTVTTEVFRSRFLWNVKVTARGREEVVTEMGEFPAVRFDAHTYKLGRDGKRFPGTDERDFSVWISDDADRVPIQNVARTDYGAIKMTIVDYQPGAGKRLRP